MAGNNPLEAFVVTTESSDEEAVHTVYVCTCGWDTLSRLDFQQHLMSGEAKGCRPRDLNVHVTDSIGCDEKLM